MKVYEILDHKNVGLGKVPVELAVTAALTKAQRIDPHSADTDRREPLNYFE